MGFSRIRITGNLEVRISNSAVGWIFFILRIISVLKLFCTERYCSDVVIICITRILECLNRIFRRQFLVLQEYANMKHLKFEKQADVREIVKTFRSRITKLFLKF